MPSTFPEAFGMVAVEAAACGALPLSARHSGMAEVTDTLAPALPRQELQPPAIIQNGGRSCGGDCRQAGGGSWLTLDAAEREHARSALAAEAARRYSWENVARGVIAAAQGRLDELPRPRTRPAPLNYLAFFARWRLCRRTPGPPPFSSMNSDRPNRLS